MSDNSFFARRLLPSAIAPRQKRWFTTARMYSLVCRNVCEPGYILKRYLKLLAARWRIGTTTLRIMVSLSTFVVFAESY